MKPDEDQEATLPPEEEPAGSASGIPAPDEDQEATLPSEEAAASGSASDSPSAPLTARRFRGPSRRLFSWGGAIAAVLVVALITTTLIISHQSPAGPVVQRHATPTPTPRPLPVLSVYGFTRQVSPPPGGFELDGPPIQGFASAPRPQYKGRVFALNAADGTVRWQYTIPDGAGTSQVVADTVFYVGASDGNIFAFDTRDGTLLWVVKLLQYSTVEQVADGIVYASSTGKSAQGFYALDARSGKQLWQFTKKASFDLVADGAVYLSSGGFDFGFAPFPGTIPALAANVSARGEAASSPGTVYALDARTGAERWHFQHQGSLSAWRVGDGQVYVTGYQIPNSTSVFIVSQNFTLYVLDASTGKLHWFYPKKPSSKLSPVGVENGLVYLFSNNELVPFTSPQQVSSPDTLSALSASDGSVKWHTQIQAGPIRLPIGEKISISLGGDAAALSGGVIYVGNFIDPFAAYNASTGARLWRNTELQNPSLQMAADGVVYVGEQVSVKRVGLYALKASTGKALWKSLGKRLSIDGVVNGVVYVSSDDVGPPVTPRSNDNVVSARDASTGAVRWTYTLGKETATILVR
ncbi:MAG TPA: PQQ-binding-like beta-propeller repeat protein [Ktedonobacterales bacterium]